MYLSFFLVPFDFFLADFRVNKTEDICKLGDEIIVKCIGIDDKGRVKLSRRAAMEENKADGEEEKKETIPAEESPNEEEAEPAISWFWKFKTELIAKGEGFA